jgi:hypothetical protein
MHHLTRARTAAAATAALAALALAPAGAGAVQLTITDDAGNPVPLAGEPVLRNMSPTVGIAFAPDERTRYAATFAGPDGAGSATPIGCFSIPTRRQQDFRGNGVYTVTVQHFGERDTDCQTPVGPPEVHRFTINGFVTLGGPPTRVLLRRPDSLVTQPVVLPFAGNPGALGNEVRFARNGVVGPDGAIAGPTGEGFVDSATGTVPLRLTQPGRYVVVARAKGFSTPTGQFFTPWTPPVTVDAIAPFDFESARIPDNRGPSYLVRLQIRERTARGRVSIAVARGTKGRYRSVGRATIRRDASLVKRLRLPRTGTYRVRFSYGGSATVAPGRVVMRLRVSRRVVF